MNFSNQKNRSLSSRTSEKKYIMKSISSRTNEKNNVVTFKKFSEYPTLY
ncbi:hypothetical protein [Flavobacterium notoginsengisoli]